MLEAYLEVAHRDAPDARSPVRVDRFDFPERAKASRAVVMTGDMARYGNILWKKGVTLIP